jgi:hypothetical protein
MRRLIFALLALFLTFATSFAQQFNWQEMKKPYFVYDAKGVSVAWDINHQDMYTNGHSHFI